MDVTVADDPVALWTVAIMQLKRIPAALTAVEEAAPGGA
jgi:hypothetical protein